MMVTTSEKTNRANMGRRCSGQYRGAGIILTILSVLFLLGTGAARRAEAQTFTVLHNFSGSDGAFPRAGLVRDSYGNLYGTTVYGGFSNDGTVFKLDPSGTLTVLHSFSGSDGANPTASVVRDSSGNIYGTTLSGGNTIACPVWGCGTVFKLDPSGILTTLHSFSDSDGSEPIAGLVRDSSGNLYGTTVAGGSSNYGTVFKLDPSGTLTVLHSFSGSDGVSPPARLVRDSSGNLYGAAQYGGSSGWGTVFKLDPSGTLTVLHSFSGSDGSEPIAGLVRDSSGNIYGTTLSGGNTIACPVWGCGTVFKLDPSGILTTLHRFSGSDGSEPIAGLMRDSYGNLYGTTSGGSSNNGTVFKLDPSGTLTTLHSFSGIDGANPVAGLVTDSYGNLYGTSFSGGSSNYGTVFNISLTPQGATQAIITQVNYLLAQGVINKGQDNSLVIKLQRAVDMINAGKINVAIGILEGFIGEVNGLQNSRLLTGAQASALTSAATGVIEQLQAM